MILSKYTKVIPHYPKKGRFVIYSLLHDSLCVVNAHIFSKLERVNKRLELRKILFKEEYNTLNRLRIFKESNEKEVCAKLLKEMTNVTEDLNLIVYLTYRCNLNCLYCFQPKRTRRRSLTMSEETAQSLIGWIRSFCKTKKIKKLSLLFYGGEPLLNKSILEHIAKNVSQISRRIGFKYNFLITTNGTLLDKEITKKLKSYQLSDIQITIDGLKEIHDARRPFKNEKISSYERIMNNLTALSKVTSKIILRINVDKGNVDEIPFFLEMLKKKKLGEKVKIHLMPVYQSLRNSRESSKNLIPPNKLAKYLLNFYSIAEKLNLSVIPYYSAGICQFFGKFSFSITPDGGIYKCPNLLQNYFRVGDIQHELFEERNDKVRNVPMGECLGCKFILICAKGCRHQAYIRSHNINGKFCQKALLEKLMSFYIKYEVKKRVGKYGRRKRAEKK